MYIQYIYACIPIVLCCVSHIMSSCPYGLYRYSADRKEKESFFNW